MKRVINSSTNNLAEESIINYSLSALSKSNEAIDNLHNLIVAIGEYYQQERGSGYYENRNDSFKAIDHLEKASKHIENILDFFDYYEENQYHNIEEATKIEAEDDLPKGYYDDYFGQNAYEEFGDLVSEKCSGMIISKRSNESEEPGGLIYEAERLGIDDFFDLLRCLEGMCYNGTAVEISDYQYKVL